MNGIGGKTAAEAVNNLSIYELNLWQRYREKNGSLNIAMRNEIMIAQLTMLTAIANGAKNVDIYDFAPNIERPVMNFEDAVALYTR